MRLANIVSQLNNSGALAAPVVLLGDGDVDVDAVTTVDNAGPTDIGFVAHSSERRGARTTQAGALLVDADFAAEYAHELPCAVLYSDDAPRALLEVLALLQPPEAPGGPKRHPSAIIDPDATIGVDVVVGAGAIIERGVVVGDGGRIGPGVVLRTGSQLGQRVRVGAGSVIGEAGFVFAADGAANLPLTHSRGVRIDDDVDIGANVCIDRGLLRDTRIGARSRIDNLVQIAHDVVVGVDVVIVAQVGISGYATIGDGVVLAGQAGVNPHVTIAPRVRVGGRAGVTNDIVDEGAIVAGLPAQPHHDWLKGQALLRRLVRQAAKPPKA